MKESERCPECGSWGVECASDVPVSDCRCARCARAAISTLVVELTKVREKLEMPSAEICALYGVKVRAETADETKLTLIRMYLKNLREQEALLMDQQARLEHAVAERDALKRANDRLRSEIEWLQKRT